MARRPFVSITGPSGSNLVSSLGSRLQSISIVDQAGGESDTLTMVVSVSHPFPAGPTIGTRYQVSIGWTETGARHAGVYTVQSVALSGDPEGGYALTVTCRAADFLDKMKKVESESFDNQTVGQIFEKVAQGAGISAVIDPALAQIKIPYRLRWKQAGIDFLHDLASEIGGTMKPAADKLLMMQRGAKRSASGRPFPSVIIPFEECISLDLSVEARGEYQEVAGDWFDPVEGILKVAAGIGRGDASRFLPLHLLPSKDEAKRTAEAQGREQARRTVSGSLTTPGKPEATAEAPVGLQGFGREFDSLDLICACVTHDVTFSDSGGWLTTTDVESAADAAKGGKKKGGTGAGGTGGDYTPDWQVPAGGANATG